jgi:hypothetical protein
MADAGPKKAGLWSYIASAFTFRWNLLFFGGAMAAALMLPSPDIVMPVLVAGELAYLGMLASNPRFQAAIDAKAHAQGRATSGGPPVPAEVDAQRKLQELLASLENVRRNRFQQLRARCVEMQRIADAVRGDTNDASGAAADLRTPALDRLLWMFLRLLLSQQAVERFLRATDVKALEYSLNNLKQKHTDAVAKNDERIIRSVTDAMATAEMRMTNYEKARGNLEFITLELDRIEQKIHALTEMAVSHQDPDQLTIQVDAVAEGMQQTEATIRELQAITGLGADEQSTPRILGGDVVQTQGARR